MFFFWIVLFVVSLALMVKSADWLLEKAEKIGLALGVSPFVVGVTIVGAGTSFPELVAGLVSVWQGATDIVVANAIGSNVANILLVVGVSVIIAGKMVVSKNLIDLDLPLLSASTALMIGIVYDSKVTFAEAVVLLVCYVVYLVYTMNDKRVGDAKIDKAKDLPDIVPDVEEDKDLKKFGVFSWLKKRPNVSGIDFIMLLMGMVGLFFGSKFLIQSVTEIADILSISTGLIAISAVAIGTSLPELIVSVKAAKEGKAEIAIGNIFGSNVFNLLLVIGLPALFETLTIDEVTMKVGVPAVIIATLLFVISGISRKMYIWEGFFYVMLYVLFIGKLFSLI